MSEQQFGWNYFENEVVIGDKQDKKRMIVLVFSNFVDIVYNRKSFDEIVGLLNRQQTSIETMLGNMEKLEKENEQLKEIVIVLEKLISDVEASEGMSIDNLIDTEMIGDE